MQNLTRAKDSMARFQQLAFPRGENIQPTPSPSPAPCSTQRPVVHQTPPSYHPSPYPRREDTIRGRKRLYVDGPPFRPATLTPATFGESRSSPESSAECCGGLLDCDELCESDEDLDDASANGTMSRTSGVRSTSRDSENESMHS